MTDTATPGAVRETMHDAGDQARSVAETGKEEAAKLASEAKTQASKLIDEAGTKARERADSQLGSAATMLSDMSGELDRMASSASPGTALASLVRDGATMTRQLSDRLQSGGLDGALHDARMFARRPPVMFLAGAFAVGIMAGRLARNVDVRSITPSSAETGRDAAGNGSPRRWPGDAGAGPVQTSVPISTEPSADIETDWDAPRGGQATGEPA